MTPYECVGFPFRTDADYDGTVPDIVDRMIGEAERVPCPAGFEGWSYRDPSGAGLLAFVAKNDAEGTRSLTCLKPAFYGGSRQKVAAGPMIDAEECQFCHIVRIDVLDAAGAVAYPVVARISDPGFRKFTWKEGRKGEIQATLFAMELDPWKKKAEGSGKIQEFADLAFLPTGTSRNPPLPEAIVSGKVLLSEKRRNTLGGEGFIWARILSLAAEYDVVVPLSLVPEAPAPGTVLQVGARVYARRFRKV